MNFTKKMLMVVGLFANSIYASNGRDIAFERTPLMRHMIELEKNIKNKKAHIHVLEQSCFEYNNMFQKVMRPQRADDVKLYNQKQKDLKKYIGSNRISLMATVKKEKESLAARDRFGCTVLNYCETPELYNDLRAMGAPFQVRPWAYFNPMTAASVAIVSTLAVIGVYGSMTKK